MQLINRRVFREEEREREIKIEDTTEEKNIVAKHFTNTTHTQRHTTHYYSKAAV